MRNRTLAVLFLVICIGDVQGYCQTAKTQGKPNAYSKIAQPTHIVIDKINAHPGKDETAKADAKEKGEQSRKTVKSC